MNSQDNIWDEFTEEEMEEIERIVQEAEKINATPALNGEGVRNILFQYYK